MLMQKWQAYDNVRQAVLLCVESTSIQDIGDTNLIPMRAPSPCQVSLYLSLSAVYIFTASYLTSYSILPSIVLATCHPHFPLFELPCHCSYCPFNSNKLPSLFIFSHVLCFSSPFIPCISDSYFWSPIYIDLAVIALLNVELFPHNFLSSSTFWC
jgi:hypothetical protein